VNLETIEIDGDEFVFESSPSYISSDTAFSSGNAGTIEIKVRDTFKMSDSSINTSSIAAEGDSGNISIEAGSIELSNGGTISAESFLGPGLGGQIIIKAHDNLLLSDSTISVETTQADAGDIDIQAGSLLHLRDSRITTSVAGGLGSGGNINIDPRFVLLDNGRIIANAFEGRGGNIRIVSDFFVASPDSLVDASSRLGLSGSVVIDSPDTELTGGLVALPANFLDAAAILPQACAERLGSEVSRLVVRPYEVLPDSPYALRVGLPNAPDAFGER
jgi:large exoprotein involved in heme utilization and adhesion